MFKNTFLFSFILLFSCGNSAKPKVESQKLKVENIETKLEFKTGADNFEKYIPLLENKKAGIVTNQSGILTNKTHLVDFLLTQKINIQKIYAPEHGFRGTADAGEVIKDGKDTKTGLPIISLYGNNKKPKPEQLEGIDIMVLTCKMLALVSTLIYLLYIM